MWTDRGKQIAIAINLEQIQLIQYLDGTQNTSLNAIKAINRGIFVNPTLDKKKYLSLLKTFHPDVSNLDTKIATQIAQTIISTKDGKSTVSNLWRTNYTAESNQQSNSEPRYKTASDFATWWRTYGSRNEGQKKSSNSSNNSSNTGQSKSASKERDFATWLGYVPTSYWDRFGSKDTFERDRRVEFRIFKRCYYAYFDTELEIVFRKGCIYREKVVAIHRNIFRIIHQIDLSTLNKNDLWNICELEGISYTKSARKTDLVDDVMAHFVGLFVNPTEVSNECYWTLSLEQSKPLWKHKFIDENYHDNFEQFSTAKRQARSKSESDSRSQSQSKVYLNCGQYLRLRKLWLERDEFLYFLNLTRKVAQKYQVQISQSDGYPSYPMEILDLAWAKMGL